jgi:hypothetical protein
LVEEVEGVEAVEDNYLNYFNPFNFPQPHSTSLNLTQLPYF